MLDVDLPLMEQSDSGRRLQSEEKGCHMQKIASAGNRTRAARVAGEPSTTEPPMLDVDLRFMKQSDSGRRPQSREKGCQMQKIASAGNRTRAARVAGEHSTTEPPMLEVC